MTVRFSRGARADSRSVTIRLAAPRRGPGGAPSFPSEAER